MKKSTNLYMQVLTKVFVCFMLLQIPGNSQAQTAADTARAALVAIDSAYSNAFYLGFDIKIIYQSDTLWAGTDSADFTYTEMLGNYTFNGNRALYKLGDIEYLQNDLYTIALYKENKILLVGKPDTPQTTSSFMPTKPVFDTMMARLDLDYVCSVEDMDDIKCIHFVALNDSSVVFKKIRIDYNPVSFLLRKVTYEMVDYEYSDDPSTQSDPIARDIVLSFDFMNYRIEQVSPEVFSEMKYLFFDGPEAIKPASAYKDFTIYKSY